MINKCIRRKKPKGMSLLEVMIAFILIGVGSLGLIQLQVYMERQAEHATTSLDALNMIETQLELFKTGSVGTAASNYSFNQIVTDCNAMTKNTAAANIQLTCRASKLASLSNRVSTIQISAYWLDREQTEQTVSVNTMISEYNEFNPN